MLASDYCYVYFVSTCQRLLLLCVFCKCLLAIIVTCILQLLAIGTSGGSTRQVLAPGPVKEG